MIQHFWFYFYFFYIIIHCCCSPVGFTTTFQFFLDTLSVFTLEKNWFFQVCVPNSVLQYPSAYVNPICTVSLKLDCVWQLIEVNKVWNSEWFPQHQRLSQSIVSIPHVCQYFYLLFVRKVCTLAGPLMTLLCGQPLTGGSCHSLQIG